MQPLFLPPRAIVPRGRASVRAVRWTSVCRSASTGLKPSEAGARTSVFARWTLVRSPALKGTRTSAADDREGGTGGGRRERGHFALTPPLSRGHVGTVDRRSFRGRGRTRAADRIHRSGRPIRPNAGTLVLDCCVGRRCLDSRTSFQTCSTNARQKTAPVVSLRGRRPVCRIACEGWPGVIRRRGCRLGGRACLRPARLRG